MDTTDPTAALGLLLDERAIQQVCCTRYARSLDWLDTDELKTCFWPDGHVDYGFFVGNAHEWCEIVMPIEASSLHRFHSMFDLAVQIDGDRAEAECNGLAGSRRIGDDGEGYQSLHGSRYLDRLERRDGEWRIAERTVLLEMTQKLPSPAGPGGALAGLELVSGLSPADPRYRRL